MRTVPGRTDHVVVVGAGLGGLACALHLAGAGRQVTVLERADVPGGRAGRLDRDGYTFDTGPTVLTMPDLIAEGFAAVGEDMADWLTLTPLDPAYRAWFPDGSKLDVIADPDRMAEEIAQVCGHREADGYRRFVDYARRLWELERHDFIERNFDSPRDLLTANLLRLVAAGAFGRLQNRVDSFLKDERTRRVFSFQAMYAGLSPHKALAVYTVIAYLDSVAGVYFPRGGMHAVPRAMAAAAEKHGVRLRYGTEALRVETSGGRATAVVTTDGERIAADAVVLNPDTAAAHALLPGSRPRELRYSPSCVVLHLGSSAEYPEAGHHNIHFGREWRRTFDEVITKGELMSDPSLLVTNPSRTDPSAAPAGRHTYYVLAPVPNLVTGDQDWRGALADRYADELIDVLEARGYPGFKAGVQTRTVITPADWADQGMDAGTPFAAAHTLTQSGPFRPRNLHPALSNVVFTGSGTTPGVGVPMVLISGKLAAQRIIGG
ncbi:phytoene desaturase family protein [Catellatospora chokoriensis]|uniref:Phytoene dehydrogenase n=1 Tax=Catellatospora chokoriensis TaxID=310353 RepID=A0A8J3JYP4_9ACTN|nr:phytoene desaturase family protein [Catellatospora chokoriensis]GIF93542.1 phytoene dehydrogenase [Catellatospora chokoriensis]